MFLKSASKTAVLPFSRSRQARSPVNSEAYPLPLYEGSVETQPIRDVLPVRSDMRAIETGCPSANRQNASSSWMRVDRISPASASDTVTVSVSVRARMNECNISDGTSPQVRMV